MFAVTLYPGLNLCIARYKGCCDEQMQVGSHYDPMIAKVITQGDDRDEALARMHTALSKIEVLSHP